MSSKNSLGSASLRATPAASTSTQPANSPRRHTAPVGSESSDHFLVDPSGRHGLRISAGRAPFGLVGWRIAPR
ncbi:MAG TPA: hypothetical protein QGG16_06480, partial [Acidimicrobiales bacterium]|nr:hypothetical protein [Acidimicrobiales bacterium]